MGAHRNRTGPPALRPIPIGTLLFAIAAFSARATAAEAPPSTSATATLSEIEVPLVLNATLLGELSVRVDPTGTQPGDVDALRLMTLLRRSMPEQSLAPLTQRIGNRARVPLAELSGLPFTIEFDTGNLQLLVTASTDLMRVSRIDLSGSDTPDLSGYQPQSRFAGGVAIAAEQQWRHSGPSAGREPLRLTLDGFITAGPFPGITLRGGADLIERTDRSGFAVVRNPVRASYDLFDQASHLTAGEITPPTTGFQGSGPLLGFAVARDFSAIRPFENVRPAARGFITLDRRSTVIVEVNGLETRKLLLEPGRYELANITGPFGASLARLYIEDDLGRREITMASFFTAATLLGDGLSEFGFSVGKIGSGSGRYNGPFVASGYFRWGAGNQITLGGGAQFADGNWQTSGEIIWGTVLGVIRLQGALSHVEGQAGRSASLDWLHTTELAQGKLNLALAASVTSRRFGSPFDSLPPDNDSRWRIDARADWQRGAWGLIAAGSFNGTRSGSAEQGYSLTGYWSGQRLSLTASAGASRFGAGRWAARASVGISLRLGRRGNLSLRGDSYRSSGSLELARYPRDEIGDLSGRVRLDRDDRRHGATGSLRYFGNRLLVNADQDWYSSATPDLPDQRFTRLRLATFVGFADGMFGIGRPPTYGFAIFKPHSSLGSAKVLVRDEAGFKVGRPGLLGPALVPLNRSFSPIELTADADPLPAGYNIGDPRLKAFPGSASAYGVRIGSDAWRIASGFLLTPNGPLAGIAGTVEKIGDKKFEKRLFFTNSAGRFAVDQLSPGEYRMMIGEHELARFKVDPNAKGMIDVGKITVARP